MPRQPEQTLFEVAVENLRQGNDIGWLRATTKAAEALSVVPALIIAAEHGANPDGAWPTQMEYAAYWKISLRRAQREWELFRKAFPHEESPDRLAQRIRDDVGARLVEKRRAYVQTLPATLALA